MFQHLLFKFESDIVGKFIVKSAIQNAVQLFLSHLFIHAIDECQYKYKAYLEILFEHQLIVSDQIKNDK